MFLKEQNKEYCLKTQNKKYLKVQNKECCLKEQNKEYCFKEQNKDSFLKEQNKEYCLKEQNKEYCLKNHIDELRFLLEWINFIHHHFTDRIDFHESLSLFVSFIYHFWQVFQTTSCVYTERT